MVCEHHPWAVINELHPRKYYNLRKENHLHCDGVDIVNKSTFCFLLAEAQKQCLESLLWTEPKPNKLYQGI